MQRVTFPDDPDVPPRMVVLQGFGEKPAILAHHALYAPKRFFGRPAFRYYALADRLAEILTKRSAHPFPRPTPRDTTGQPDRLSFLFR